MASTRHATGQKHPNPQTNPQRTRLPAHQRHFVELISGDLQHVQRMRCDVGSVGSSVSEKNKNKNTGVGPKQAAVPLI